MKASLLWTVALAFASINTASAQPSLERGKYLVEGILTCGNCHTPRGPKGVLDKSRLHAGGPVPVWETDEYVVRPTNITPHRETGIGAWSAEDVKRSIRDGFRPNGQQLAPQMPYGFYKIFTPSDLDAVVAYVLAQPAVANKVPPPVYKVKTMHVDIPPGAEKPMSEADLKDPVKRGFYLTTIGHCMECHTPKVNGRHDYKGNLGAGGYQFKGPWGVSVSRNITSHPQNGIGAWSDAEIKRAITQGVRKDGSKLLPPMGYEWYATMTDADLSAIVAYLRTVPPR